MSCVQIIQFGTFRYWSLILLFYLFSAPSKYGAGKFIVLLWHCIPHDPAIAIEMQMEEHLIESGWSCSHRQNISCYNCLNFIIALHLCRINFRVWYLSLHSENNSQTWLTNNYACKYKMSYIPGLRLITMSYNYEIWMEIWLNQNEGTD